MKRLVLGIVMIVACSAGAVAGPPASCRDKFVGTWKYFGGSTVVHPDGTATPSVGVPVQHWTCNGNEYIFRNPDGQTTWTSTLSADCKKLVGAGTAKRVGPPPAGCGSSAAAKGALSPDTSKKQNAATGSATDCLGIKSKGKAEYSVVNSCSFKVNFVIETMGNDRKKTRENLYVEARGRENFIFSYFSTRPVIVSARKGH